VITSAILKMNKEESFKVIRQCLDILKNASLTTTKARKIRLMGIEIAVEITGACRIDEIKFLKAGKEVYRLEIKNGTLEGYRCLCVD
jgi:hypothetical protein